MSDMKLVIQGVLAGGAIFLLGIGFVMAGFLAIAVTGKIFFLLA
jgi:hypothetical protein